MDNQNIDNKEDRFSSLIDEMMGGSDIKNKGLEENENLMIDASYKLKDFFSDEAKLSTKTEEAIIEKKVNDMENKEAINPEVKEKKPNFLTKFLNSLKYMPLAYKVASFIVILVLLAVGSYVLFSITGKNDNGRVARDKVDVTGIVLVKTGESLYGVKSKDSAFEIKFDTEIADNQNLSDQIIIEPKIDVEIKEANARKSIVINPKNDLDKGKTYKVILAKGLAMANGKETEFDKEWKFRVEPEFSLTGTTPKNLASYVPTNTAIEFEFNYSNLPIEKFSEYVTFDPKIDGNFELHGRKIIYKAKELYPNTTYDVKVKAGFSNNDGYMIKTDKEFSFLTTYAPTNGIYQNAPSLTITKVPYVASYASSPDIEVEISNLKPEEVKANIYSIDNNGIKEFITNLKSETEYTKKPEDKNLKKLAEVVFVKGSDASASNAILGYKFEKGTYLLEIYSAKLPYKKYRVITISDFDVVLEKGRDKTSMWVYDFSKLKFISSVSIEVFTKDDNSLKSIFSGSTDSKGYLSYASISGNPDLIIAKSGDKVFYLADIPVNNWAYSERSYMPYGGLYDNDYRNYIYTDRPVYRRGDKINFKFITRKEKDFNFTSPSGKVVTIKATDTSEGGSVVFEKKYTLDEWASVSDEFKIPTNFAGYGLSLTAQIDGDKNIYNGFVRITEFEKSAYDISINFDKTNIIDSETVNVTLSVKDIVGKPYKGNVNVKMYMGDYSEPNYSGSYDKDIFPSYFYGVTKIEEKVVSINDEGIGTMTLNPKVMSYGKQIDVEAYVYTLEVEVADDKGLNQISTSGIVVWEGDKRISLKPLKDSDTYGKTGKEITEKIKLTHPITGEAIKNTNINSNFRREWYEQVETGSYYDPNTKSTVKQYRSDLKTEDLGGKVINSGDTGETEFKFTPAKTGNYILRLDVSGVDAEFHLGSFYESETTGDGAYLINGKEYIFDNGLKVTLEKQSYKVGEQMDAKLESSLQAEALMLIKRGEVYEWQIIDLSKSKTISYGIKDRDYPSIDFEILFPSAGLSLKDQTSTKEVFTSSLNTITVEDSSRELKIDVTGVKGEYAPSEKADGKIAVYDSTGKKVDAELSFAVIDKSILANYSDNSDGVVDYFTKQVNQRTKRIYNRVDKESMEAGGRGDGGDQTRKNILDTAYWNGKLKALGGDAIVSFNMPDNLTAWSIIAVAITKDGKVGRYVGDTKTSKDFYVNFEVPQFLRFNDNLNLYGRVYNYTSVVHNGSLKFSGENCKLSKDNIDFKINPKSAAPFNVGVTALAESGSCKLIVGFSENNKVLDSLEKQIPLKGAGYYKTNTVQKFVDKESELKFNVEKKGDRDKLTLTLKKDIVQSGDLNFSYAEVNSGWAITGALAKNITLWEEWDKLGLKINKEDLSDLINYQITSLYSLQDSTGGISYFGYDANDFELSGLVGYLVGRLEKSGFVVATNFKLQLGEYLLGNLYNPELNSEEKVLALKGLQGLSYNEALSSASYIFSMRKDMIKTPYALAILGNVLYEEGSISDAEIIAEELLKLAQVGENYAFFDDANVVYKNIKTKEFIASEALELYSRVGGYDEVRVKITNWLSENTNFGTLNAEEDLIYANLIKYRKVSNATDGVVKVEFNGVEIWNGDIMDEKVIEIKDYNVGENIIKIKGAGIYSLLGTSLLSTQTASANTFSVKTEYLDLLTGKKLTDLKKGQFIKIRTTIVPNVDASKVIVRNSLPASVKAIDDYYSIGINGVGSDVIDKWFEDSWSNKMSRNMVDYNDFFAIDVKAGKTYTFDTLAIAFFSGKFETGANQAFVSSFTDLSGVESGRLINIVE